jgi:hypothetical protein
MDILRLEISTNARHSASEIAASKYCGETIAGQYAPQLPAPGVQSYRAAAERGSHVAFSPMLVSRQYFDPHASHATLQSDQALTRSSNNDSVDDPITTAR